MNLCENEMHKTCNIVKIKKSQKAGRQSQMKFSLSDSGVPRIFFFGGGSTNSVEDRGQRGQGSGGGSPLVRGSGGSCNLVQEISFHIVKFS